MLLSYHPQYHLGEHYNRVALDAEDAVSMETITLPFVGDWMQREEKNRREERELAAKKAKVKTAKQIFG